MPEFDSNIKKYREKKEEILATPQKKEKETGSANILSNAPALKEKKREDSKDAYRKILAADFDNAEWISLEAPMRKHRKNIAKDHKALTGRKRGLSGKEKLQRKTEFENRREISINASMALETFIGSSSDMDPDPADEGILKAVEEMDLNQFAYGDGSGTQEELTMDQEFVLKFPDRMAILHNATLLYNKIRQGNNDTVSQALLSKLSQMNDMRQAYEDRIRIISSPYYVSLRDVDFDKSTKERLRNGNEKEAKEKGDNLNNYAGAVLRWQESGKKLLSVKKAAAQAAPVEKDVQDENVLSEDKTYVSDQAVDNVINKINMKNKHTFNVGVNGTRDPAMAYAKNWVYDSLKKKTSDKDLMDEVNKMKDWLRKELSESGMKEFERKNKEKVLRHLDRVTKAFDEKKISSDVMRIWLDRCLQHKLNYSKDMYNLLVYQGRTDQDEDHYEKKVAEAINPYVQKMSGVVFSQNMKSYGVYQRKADVGETDDPALLRARRGFKNEVTFEIRNGKKVKKEDIKIHEFSGIGAMMSTSKGDFIHINGKNADYNDIATRAYISAKPKYKSLVVKLFTETVAEFKTKNMRDELYFKISKSKDENRGFAADDLTVYLGSNVSLEERKQLLDSFYEKCSKEEKKRGECILDGENMIVAGSKYKEGIAIAGEPDIASLLNKHFSNEDKKSFHSAFSNRDKLEKIRDLSTKEVIRDQFSFNTFVIAMLAQSTFLTAYRRKMDVRANINTNDQEVREEMKKIFRELCFLNGINPETMGDIDNKTVLG